MKDVGEESGVTIDGGWIVVLWWLTGVCLKTKSRKVLFGSTML